MVNEIRRLKKLAVLESPVAKKASHSRHDCLLGGARKRRRRPTTEMGTEWLQKRMKRRGFASSFPSFLPSFLPLLSVSFTKGGKASLQDRASPAQKREEKRFTFNSFFYKKFHAPEPSQGKHDIAFSTKLIA